MSRLQAIMRFGNLALLLFCGLALGCAGSKSTTPVSNTASEDMSHLLVTPVSVSGELDFDAPRDFLPDRNVDWVVTVQFAEPCESLLEVVAKCDQDVTLWLRAPSGQRFAGRDVWDVMLCLRLDYGDGDLFHWINNSGFGDDHFFTVQTSTPPGYFVPQKMASGVGDVDDLMFNFSIPRSADPMTVFDSMVNAVKYAQGRLGGEIVTDSESSFDDSAERARVESVVEELNRAGFVPGESSTCRIF